MQASRYMVNKGVFILNSYQWYTGVSTWCLPYFPLDSVSMNVGFTMSLSQSHVIVTIVIYKCIIDTRQINVAPPNIIPL